MAANATIFHQEIADAEKSNALREIARLEHRLAQLRIAMEADNRPHSSSGGELGLIGSAVEVQRHVDAWVSAATTVTVLGHYATRAARQGVVHGNES